jgi:hypothetical protein
MVVLHAVQLQREHTSRDAGTHLRQHRRKAGVVQLDAGLGVVRPRIVRSGQDDAQRHHRVSALCIGMRRQHAPDVAQRVGLLHRAVTPVIALEHHDRLAQAGFGPGTREIAPDAVKRHRPQQYSAVQAVHRPLLRVRTFAQTAGRHAMLPATDRD